MKTSKWRGHNIYESNDIWYYLDTRQKVYDNPHRICGRCMKSNIDNEHDSCIINLSNVLNACCGHGDINDAYVQFKDYKCIKGQEAIDYFERIKNEDTKIY